MPSLISQFEQVIIWALFFATSVYGHVAYKLAASEQEQFSLWHTLFGFWGISAGVAWVVSGVLWVLLLVKSPLLTASSISSLRYGFIVLAAIIWLGERLTWGQSFGVVLIMVGIYFVAR
jgi:drug/metabolite transporter (DMT)-like permease